MQWYICKSSDINYGYTRYGSQSFILVFIRICWCFCFVFHVLPIVHNGVISSTLCLDSSCCMHEDCIHYTDAYHSWMLRLRLTILGCDYVNALRLDINSKNTVTVYSNVVSLDFGTPHLLVFIAKIFNVQDFFVCLFVCVCVHNLPHYCWYNAKDISHPPPLPPPHFHMFWLTKLIRSWSHLAYG